jgi:AraC-like DNA-binding protein
VDNLLEETAAALSQPAPLLYQDPDYQARVQQWAVIHDQSHEILWTTGFHVLDETPLMPCPRTISVQTVSDPRYHSDGTFRLTSNECYFCCTLEGQGWFRNERGAYSITRGRGFLTEINDPQAGYFYSDETRAPWRFLAFTFVGLPAQSLVRGLAKTYGSVFEVDLQTPIIKRLLAFESRSIGLVDLHLVDAAALVLDFLMTLAAAARAGEATDATAVLVRRAIQLTAVHLEEDLSVERLAALAGTSREHLSRAFRKRLGVSPRQFLLTQKMRQACYLLKETNLPIKQIAGHIGYTTYANFFAAFRRECGMTPHDFRLRGVFSRIPSG